MLAFVEGEPVGKGADYIVLSVGGLGFRIFVPQSRVDTLAVSPRVKLHTYMAVREDSISLFGLNSDAELSVFRQLISVSGVGPRLALAILSTWSTAQLEQILAREDVNALTTVAGIGRKTAQRLLLELKDKIAGSDFEDESVKLLTDAEAALTALGFRSSEVRPVLRTMVQGCTNVEELVRRALARLTGGELQ